MDSCGTLIRLKCLFCTMQYTSLPVKQHTVRYVWQLHNQNNASFGSVIRVSKLVNRSQAIENIRHKPLQPSIFMLVIKELKQTKQLILQLQGREEYSKYRNVSGLETRIMCLGEHRKYFGGYE